MKEKRKPAKLYTIIIWNFVLFTILTAIIFILFAKITIHNLNQGGRIDFEGLAWDYGASYDYTYVDHRSYLGGDSYVQIYDAYGNLEYSTNESKDDEILTEKEIQLIPEHGDYKFTHLSTYDDLLNDRRFYVINRGVTDPDTGDFHEDVAIAEENGQVEYSTSKAFQGKFSKNELNLVSGKLGTQDIMKLEFKREDGEPKYMVVVGDDLALSSKDSIIWSITSDLVGMGFVYIVILVIFSFMIYHKIASPLKELDRAITTVGNKGIKDSVVTIGPREFREIGENFAQMTQELDEEREKVWQITKEKNRLISDISHDIKTPLTIITGYSKAISDGLVPEEEIGTYISIINKRAESLNRLVEEFNQLSSLDHPNKKLSLARQDICELVRGYIANRYDEISSQGFEIDLVMPEGQVFVQIDWDVFKRVFGNMISNLYKYGREATMLFLAIEEDEENIKIYLGDNGKGLSEDKKDSIFKPFVTGDDARGDGNHGLGLSIVKRICQLHGGDIGLTDRHKFLSIEFEIVLPKG